MRHRNVVSLWDLMQQFSAADLASAAGLFEGSSLVLKLAGNESWVDSSDAIEDGLVYAQQILRTLGLSLAVVQADRIRGMIHVKKATNAEMQAAFDELSRRTRDELEQRCFLAIASERQRYFSPDSPLWGDEFQRGFQSAAYDLDEAAKCFALGRYTATAFHSLRVAEIGIRAIARCLGVPDPIKPAQRNWGSILKSIDAAIDAKWPGAARGGHGDGATFDALYASLDAMKNPLRNATMHVEAVYGEEDARAIFDAVGHFMRRLAARCDEQGLPVA